MASPKYVANVQTCRGSHTHTVVTDPRDKDNVYIYVSGSAGVRSAEELPAARTADRRSGQRAVPHRSDQGAARGAGEGGDRQLAAHLLRPGAAATPRRAGSRWRWPGRGRRCGWAARRRCGGAPGLQRVPVGAVAGAADAANTGPNQCHDITVYPDIGFAGGACGGYGLLLDIKEVANPKRIDRRPTSTCRSGIRRRSATTAPRCCSPTSGAAVAAALPRTDKNEWGANALFTIDNGKMIQELLQDAGAADGARELRRAQRLAHSDSGPRRHGAGLVSGRHLGVRLDRPRRSRRRSRSSIAARSSDAAVTGGSWSVYWYNGLIVSSEIARPRHLRAGAERPHLAERDRRGQDGAGSIT